MNVNIYFSVYVVSMGWYLQLFYQDSDPAIAKVLSLTTTSCSALKKIFFHAPNVKFPKIFFSFNK